MPLTWPDPSSPAKFGWEEPALDQLGAHGLLGLAGHDEDVELHSYLTAINEDRLALLEPGDVGEAEPDADQFSAVVFPAELQHAADLCMEQG